ncbi:MAG: ribonuclease domain-containing protein [Janthinobacterium lividum]
MRGLLIRMRRGALALTVAAGCLGSMTNAVHARDFTARAAPAWVQNYSPVIPVSNLPVAAARLLATIRAGGEFPYEKDGAIFGNRERLLPRQPRGYYREYTVPTPRARDRGARRIVCGGPPRTTDECYYTDDHYSSFKRIQG